MDNNSSNLPNLPHTPVDGVGAGSLPVSQLAYARNGYGGDKKVENAFKPDICDFIFALVAFVLGYLFSRWVFFFWQGWGVSAFTTAYLLAATV